MRIISRILSKLRPNPTRDRLINGFRSGINKSFEKLSKRNELTAEQKKAIQKYYKKKIGMEVPTDWHRYFTSRRGEFDVRYIPNAIYVLELRRRLNYIPFQNALSDKNLQDIILPQANQPEVILKNINGYYYIDNNPVTFEDALDKCSDIGDFIIKPSLLSKGRGVARFYIEKGIISETGEELSDLWNEYGKNFIMQRVIRQHKDMKALNPSSINTIRILSYRSGDEILILYTVARIGRKGEVIDNESAGGISVSINPDGKLVRYAYGAPGQDKIEYTDSGVRLEGYQLPSFMEAVEMVKKLHLHVPFFNIVGWDISIDENGKPVMIEWNANPGLSQSATGPGFGQYTDRVLEEAMKHECSCTIEAYSNFVL